MPSEEGIAEFASYEEAERRAGYHIVRPSEDFVLVDGVTYLETAHGSKRRSSAGPSTCRDSVLD